jgi:hypothetical protein
MGPSQRVLIALAPRMFADSLGRLIGDDDLEVIIAPEPTDEQLADPDLTVAVVPDGIRVMPKASLVIIVHEPPTGGLLAEAQFAEGLRVAVRHLSHLLKFVAVALHPNLRTTVEGR